jgi:hypothetical protein
MVPKLFTRLMTAALVLSIVAISCSKEKSSDELTPQEEQQVALASSQTETESDMAQDDIFNNVIGVDTEVGIGGVGIFGRSNSGTTDLLTGRPDSIRCFTVTTTLLNAPAPFPRRVVVDFGTGCLGRDGRMRSGKIVTVYTGRLLNAGSMATTEFVDHKVDSVLVEGVHKITNTTGNTPGSNFLEFTIEAINMKLTKPNGNYSKWNGIKKRTQVEGNGTPLPVDDMFRITGHSHGQVKHGNLLFNWRSEITEPLFRKFTCRWVQKGIVKSWRETLPSTSPWIAILNYGPGTCDNQATLTINGVTQQITLR